MAHARLNRPGCEPDQAFGARTAAEWIDEEVGPDAEVRRESGRDCRIADVVAHQAVDVRGLEPGIDDRAPDGLGGKGSRTAPSAPGVRRLAHADDAISVT